MIKSLNTDILNSLSSSEIEVLKYIDNNKEEVLGMSIQELSKKIFISTATIMRLCKKLNLSGFSELKYHIREKKKSEILQSRESTSLKEILDKTLLEVRQAYNLIYEKNINEAVNLLLEDKNIHFFAKGLTNSAFQYISKQLLTCNRMNICYEDTHIAYLAADRMSEKDALFVASLSGETRQVIKMVQIAKSKGATIIAITSMDNSIISKLADINFYVYSEEDSKNPYDMKSRLPILFILNVIVRYYVERKKELKD